MQGLNVVNLLGNLGEEPKVSVTKSGIKVAQFSLATSEAWYDKQTGEKKQKTEWHRITAWRELAEIVEKYCHKGSRIHLTGKLETSEYTDSDGIKRWVTKIIADNVILLDRQSHNENTAAKQPAKASDDDFGDEIPF